MKKKILVLTPFYKPFIGGAEVSIEEIIRRLAAEFDFIILTGQHQAALAKEEKDGEAIIFRLGPGWGFLDRIFFPFLALRKSFSLEFDLVYAVMASYAGAAALLIKIFKGRPYILNLQSGTLDTPEYRRIIWWFYPLYKLIHTQAQAIHAISAALKNRAVKLGAPPENVFVIANGIDLDKFQPLGRERFPYRVITVARLEKVKGVEYLIRAAPLVLKQVPQAEFLIIGVGSQRQSLVNLASQLGVSGKINFLGEIAHEQLPDFLNTGSIFVGPSLQEGLGVAFLEAMACGLAVIGTRVGGIPDLIEDDVNGLLVKPADPAVLAAAISKLLKDNQLREKFSANSANLIKNFFWDMIVKKVAGLFNRI